MARAKIRFNKKVHDAPQMTWLAVKVKGKTRTLSGMRKGNNWVLLRPNGEIPTSMISGWSDQTGRIYPNYTLKTREDYTTRLKKMFECEPVQKTPPSSNMEDVFKMVEKIKIIDNDIIDLRKIRERLVSEVNTKLQVVQSSL